MYVEEPGNKDTRQGCALCKVTLDHSGGKSVCFVFFWGEWKTPLLSLSLSLGCPLCSRVCPQTRLGRRFSGAANKTQVALIHPAYGKGGLFFHFKEVALIQHFSIPCPFISNIFTQSL